MGSFLFISTTILPHSIESPLYLPGVAPEIAFLKKIFNSDFIYQKKGLFCGIKNLRIWLPGRHRERHKKGGVVTGAGIDSWRWL